MKDWANNILSDYIQENDTIYQNCYNGIVINNSFKF